MDLSKNTTLSEIWSRDKLNRKGYADFLYKVIETAKTSEAEDNALIFAIDGEWGTGKSFFIECWIEDLLAKGHLVSRFDAWKNDIVDEPLIGFLSHIYADIGVWDKKSTVEVAGEKIKQSQKYLLPFAKEIAKGVAVKAVGSLITEESAKELFKTVADGFEKVNDEQTKEEQSMSDMLIHRQLQAHHENLKLIEDFKIKLSDVAENIVSDNERKTPVFVFIDELDRCRPDYAVRLLEVVKHIFNSKGICFISSVNISQLQKSIKTIYGQDFESDRYLDRFFGHRLKLPTPSASVYISSLKIFQKIKDNKIRWNSNSNSMVDHFNKNYVNFYGRLCSGCGFDLRTIKNIFSRLEICRDIIISDENEKFFHDEILFLMICYFKINNNKSSDPFAILSLSNFNFGDLEYFYYSESFASTYLTVTKLSDLFDSLHYINVKQKNPRESYEATDEVDKVRRSLAGELGGEGGNLGLAAKRLIMYMQVCQMSGRLDS